MISGRTGFRWSLQVTAIINKRRSKTYQYENVMQTSTLLVQHKKGNDEEIESFEDSSAELKTEQKEMKTVMNDNKV